MIPEVEHLLRSNNLLGEGAAWDDARGVLCWVDIDRCLLLEFSPATGAQTSIEMEVAVCALGLLADSTDLVIATARRFAIWQRRLGRHRMDSRTPSQDDLGHCLTMALWIDKAVSGRGSLGPTGQSFYLSLTRRVARSAELTSIIFTRRGRGADSPDRPAGDLFRIRPGVRGMPEPRFREP